MIAKLYLSFACNQCEIVKSLRLIVENRLQIKGWRDGRVAEGDGLLNRYTAKSRIGGSNPPLSAIFYKGIVMVTHKGTHKFQSR